MSDPSPPKGAISWMARNPVAANLLMVVLIVGGLLTARNIKQEVFPEFDLDMARISVPYPGASPKEVEKSIIKVIEEEVRGLDDIKRVTSVANEGIGSVTVELLLGTDANKALQDIKNAVDRIVTFPEEAERPRVSLMTRRRKVISLVLHGQMQERELRKLAENSRDELLAKDDITLVELSGIRPVEISIEIPQKVLREYDLTLGEVAAKVRMTAMDLPGGSVETKGGDILLRLTERRDLGSEFRNISIISRDDGTEVTLSQIATIKDDFRDVDKAAFFDGEPAAMVNVFRTGDQTPIEVSDVIKEYAGELRGRLPEGVGVAIWSDSSKIYRERIDLLLRNAYYGLILVLILLGVFLDVRLAFWVTMGIPMSFLGAMLSMPACDVSINMISLFAFIISLGMVVDDAIVVGENIHEARAQGLPNLKAAVTGARQLAVPVTFSILTNIAAFGPMFFVPGVAGKIFRVIPTVVVAVFIISLVECLFVLPAHLRHQREPSQNVSSSLFRRLHSLFPRLLQWFIARIYRPIQRAALSYRYLTLAIGIAMLVMTAGFVKSGRIGFRFFPLVESEVVRAEAVLPYGSPVSETEDLQRRMLVSAREVLAEYGGERITKGIYAEIDENIATVSAFLVPSAERRGDEELGIEALSTTKFSDLWRERLGEVPGLESLKFDANIGGPSAGAAINVELSHKDIDTLERCAGMLAEELEAYTGVKDIDDGFTRGKPQLDFEIKPEGRSLGLTAVELGRQVRNCFYGAEALRQQRGRDEVRVMVRLPEEERSTEHSIENLVIRTPADGEVLFFEAASLKRGRSYTQIKRVDGRRSINVTADVIRGVAEPGKVTADLGNKVLPRLMADHPGLKYDLAGEMRERAESLASLQDGFLIAMIVIFAMLAIPFKSYIQPLIVMASIPFGIVGAVLGHLIMGYDLNIISMFGMVALAGVVVNDSLLLIDTANRKFKEGESSFEAISQAGCRRFRPILLTSLTTFLGLTPMIFETSIQARILIPMAISLGYGILFATSITLLLVPSLYLVARDVKLAAKWMFPSMAHVYATAATVIVLAGMLLLFREQTMETVGSFLDQLLTRIG